MDLEQTEVWITVIGWCRFCWWRHTSEFHISVPQDHIQKAMIRIHDNAAPKCFKGKDLCMHYDVNPKGKKRS